MNEERWIEMETKISFQEMAIEKLDEVVNEQQKHITRLEKALRDLTTRLKSSASDPEIGSANEKPPHY